eukprot:1999294-Alexandrium_andersonii.AAC.1
MPGRRSLLGGRVLQTSNRVSPVLRSHPPAYPAAPTFRTDSESDNRTASSGLARLWAGFEKGFEEVAR